jgi:hypothetical protein
VGEVVRYIPRRGGDASYAPTRFERGMTGTLENGESALRLDEGLVSDVVSLGLLWVVELTRL